MDRPDSRSDTVKSDIQEDGPELDTETVAEIKPIPEAPSTESVPEAELEDLQDEEETSKQDETLPPKNLSKTAADVPSEQTAESQSQVGKTTEPERISASNPRHSHPRAQASSHTLNRLAIFTSSQNKLPTSRLKNILERVGRPTLSSGSKRCRWYKNEQYVDMNSYSWKNLALYIDYQKQMWTENGTIKSTNKK